MKTLATLMFLVLCHGAVAQAPLYKHWDRRFGGIYNETLNSFHQTTDGGYILGGWSNSGADGDKTQVNWSWTKDYWVIKIDAFGNKQWDKRFGGTQDDELISLEQTVDGGYILGGISKSDSNGDKTQRNRDTTGGLFGFTNDYWVIRIDSLGNKQWDRRFGGIKEDVLRSVQQSADGGYILGGYSFSDTSGDKTQPFWGNSGYSDYWVVKIDPIGNKQWDRRFGGTYYEMLYDVKQTTDGGYILGGISNSGMDGDKTETSRGNYDYWIVKIDSIGDKEWDKRFGGTNYDYMRALELTADGGYILGGYSSSDSSGDKTQHILDTMMNMGAYDFWIVKTDSLGTKQWDKKFGGLNSEEEFGNIIQVNDGGYLLAGTSYSDRSGDKSEDNLGQEQTWIVKTDSLGNKQWDKTLRTLPSVGSPPDDEIGFGIETIDGCFAFANYTKSGIAGDKTQSNWDTTNSEWDYWIIKFCDSSHIPQCNLASPTITTTQTTFCSGDSAQVCAPAGYTSYLWNTGETTGCIKATLAGNYYVTVTDNSGCSAESNHLAITVYPLPPVAISVNGDTLSVYGAVTQQWYRNGSAINNATSNIYIATQGGSYTVAVTDTNGCLATSTPTIISGIDNLTEEDVVSVTQMTVNEWQLTVGNNWLGSMAEIFDVNGRVVLSSKIKDQNSKLEINAARGVYLLRISSSKSSVVRKLVRL